MAAILIFKCTKGAVVGDYSSSGRGARKIGDSEQSKGSGERFCRRMVNNLFI